MRCVKLTIIFSGHLLLGNQDGSKVDPAKTSAVFATRDPTVDVPPSPRRRQVEGNLVYLSTQKPGTNPKCGGCKCELRGLAADRPRELSALSP